MTQMNIPLINLKDQIAPLRTELLAAIERIVDSQQFVLGPEVKALEDEVAQYANTKQAVGCASGSDALLLALMVLIGVTPAFFPAAVDATVKALPVLLR